MRTGIFGGTFDPIHFGHLRAASEVMHGFGLDQIFLIPAAVPPHKRSTAVSKAADRLQMMELSLSGHAGLKISDIELRRSGPSFTIDTVGHFKKTLSADSEIYLILGLDAFLEIDTWKSYRNLLEQVAFIVISRPMLDCNEFSSRWNMLREFLQANISEDYAYSDSSRCFSHPHACPIHIFDVTVLDISGTRIRELVRKGQSIEFLVPSEVEKYIKNRGLYI
jgi:nicotinate-nucleotide adenylyltransferase